VAVFENRQPVTAAKFINKCSLFILLLGVIRRLELKPISKQKVENIFVAPPYCQTASYVSGCHVVSVYGKHYLKNKFVKENPFRFNLYFIEVLSYRCPLNLNIFL
jgi:hypothetical protein